MKIERNSPCPCGSGKKYKKCCGRVEGKTGPVSLLKVDRPGTGICNFECDKDCSEWCCGGATMLTIEEIGKCCDTFPITVGFRKYAPMDKRHEDFLREVGVKAGDRYIVGDFIAGNWRKKRCLALDNEGLCRLHGEGRKPLQCLIVPFCALYPEDKQEVIFAEQRSGKFARCKGFRGKEETCCTVWKEGSFIDDSTREAFYGYQKGLRKQKPVMERILNELKGQRAYNEFLKGDGIFETHIPPSLLFDVLEAGGLSPEDYFLFLREQGRLCRDELSAGGGAAPVLEDYLVALNKIAELYAAYVRKRTG